MKAAAATSRSIEGQQAGDAGQGIIIVNERDRRTLQWLINHVGEAAISAAVAQLAGNRKPYLSNIAKALGVDLPKDLMAADRETALKHLAALQAKLKS